MLFIKPLTISLKAFLQEYVFILRKTSLLYSKQFKLSIHVFTQTKSVQRGKLEVYIILTYKTKKNTYIELRCPKIQKAKQLL